MGYPGYEWKMGTKNNPLCHRCQMLPRENPPAKPANSTGKLN